MSTVTGATFGVPGVLAEVLEVVLAVYSAIIIATIAGALGAYFLEAKATPPTASGPWWEAGDER